MSLAEGTQAAVVYKAYASGAITSNTEATSTSDLGVSGAQILRRVSSSVALKKDTYKSNEIRTDRQIFDFRHGTRRVSGSLSGELSPATYFDFFEAALRTTKASAITGTQTDFTSVTASASGKTFTFSGGDLHTKGFRAGSIVRFTNLSVSANNSTNFLITSITGSNRIMHVLPAPSDQTADSGFTIAEIGKTLTMPTSSFVSRKFGIEHNFTDLDKSHLFTECRIGGAMLKCPASGLTTVEFPVMGRDMELYTGGSAPFFTSPTDVNTNGIFAAVNGLLRVGGSTVGVVTGIDFTMALNPSSDAVVGQNFVPEIFLGPLDLTGQMTVLLEDNTFPTDFLNETEIDILAYFTTTSAVDSPAMSIYLPRIKLGDASVAVQGGAAQTMTCPFQALRYGTAAAGVDATTVRIADTQAS